MTATSREPDVLALADLAALDLARVDLEQALTEIARTALRLIPAVADASVTLLESEVPSTVGSVGPRAAALDERQYDGGVGPCLSVAAAGELAYVPDLASTDLWPGFTPAALALGVRSMLCVPVPLQREVTAALNLYADAPAAFDTDEAQDAARELARRAAVVLTNVRLFRGRAEVADALERTMAARAAVEQAKGVLMARHGYGAPAAFRRLVEDASAQRVSLRVAAERLLADALGGHDADPRTPEAPATLG